MAFWLFKQEPDEFSYDDLVAAGRTTWEGVTNALAQKHLRGVSAGDRVFLYHTGKEKSVVGIMEAVESHIDPDNEKFTIVTVKPIRKLKKPVTLADIKADARFTAWELVRISRLSVMPVPSELWKAIEVMGK